MFSKVVSRQRFLKLTATLELKNHPTLRAVIIKEIEQTIKADQTDN